MDDVRNLVDNFVNNLTDDQVANLVGNLLALHSGIPASLGNMNPLDALLLIEQNVSDVTQFRLYKDGRFFCAEFVVTDYDVVERTHYTYRSPSLVEAVYGAAYGLHSSRPIQSCDT